MKEIKFRVYLDASEYEEHFPEVSRMLSWGDLIDYTDPLQSYFNEEILGCSAPMQYTGLKDKNGVEIYEGDIIKVVSDIAHELLIVRYFMGNACYLFNKDDEAGTAIYPTLINMTKEVIGNIYENPELLEDKQ